MKPKANLSNMKKEEMAPDPSSFVYMKIIRFFLITIGAWPLKSKLMYWYLRYIVMQTSIALLGEFLYIRNNFHSLSLFDLGDKLLTMTITILVLSRVVLPLRKRYRILLHNLTTKFHLSHFKHLGKYNGQINDTIDKISNYFIVIMTTFLCWAMILFNISPNYNNYKNGVTSSYKPENYTIQFAIYYLYPFFNPANHYQATSFMNLWLSFVCTVSICFNDMLLSLMVFQVIGHIKTLQHDLSQLKKPKTHVVEMRCPKTLNVMNLCVEMFNAQENEEIHSRIVKIVEHHKVIVSFADEFSSFFGPVLGLNYLCHLFECCLVLLECSQGEPDALARYGPLGVVIFYQLVQVSVTFEVIGSESEKLKDSVYDVPWECMNTRNRRSICILLQRVQTPIHITAMGMASVGVQTMASILKTTFSYYAFLQSMSE